MTNAVKAAVRRLRSGVVPSSQLDRLSVGCDGIHELAETALMALLNGKSVFPTFVTGEWGTGKSHLLAYVRTLSATTGIATATIDLNARSAALNYPQRLLSVVARTLLVEDRKGLREIVLRVIADGSTRAQLADFAENTKCEDIGRALKSLLDAADQDGPLDILDNPAWRILAGHDLSWSDHASKRDKALDRFESIAAMFRAVGLGGLVLILDEAETIDQLWNVRSRVTAYGTLGRLLSSPAVWCVLGTTARFDRTIRADIGVEMGSDASRFVNCWQRRQEYSASPPPINERNGRLLAEKICALYSDAYGEIEAAEALVDSCLSEWRRNPIRNPRRLLRSVVSALDRQRPI